MARRIAIAFLAGTCLALVAGCGTDASPTTEAGANRASRSNLADVSNVLELRTAFNEDRGTARLLLLLSPT